MMVPLGLAIEQLSEEKIAECPLWVSILMERRELDRTGTGRTCSRSTCHLSLLTIVSILTVPSPKSID